VQRAAVIVAVALVLMGGVWVGQGLGLIRGSSFMVDDVRWALIGAVSVVAGIVIGGAARLRRRP
jgi:hypothetical protein